MAELGVSDSFRGDSELLVRMGKGNGGLRGRRGLGLRSSLSGPRRSLGFELRRRCGRLLRFVSLESCDMVGLRRSQGHEVDRTREAGKEGTEALAERVPRQRAKRRPSIDSKVSTT